MPERRWRETLHIPIVRHSPVITGKNFLREGRPEISDGVRLTGLGERFEEGVRLDK
jgi:hypothetical protein